MREDVKKQTPIAAVIREESANLVAMQRRLFDAGLIASAAAVNEAANKLGWEGVRLLEAAMARDAKGQA